MRCTRGWAGPGRVFGTTLGCGNGWKTSANRRLAVFLLVLRFYIFPCPPIICFGADAGGATSSRGCSSLCVQSDSGVVLPFFRGVKVASAECAKASL